MKTTLIMSLAALTTSILLACSKPEPDNGTDEPEIPTQDTPSIVIKQTTYTINADRCTISIPYSINNPAETGTVSAKADVEWINSGTISSTDVTLNIEANDMTETRSAIVNIIYTYGENSDTVSKSVTVEQEAMIPDPELIIDLEGTPTVPAEGGAISIPYTVKYPVEGGYISALTEVAWIKPEEISDTQVSLYISENQSTQERTAAVNIVYTYGDGETVSQPVNIIQEALEADYDYYVPNAFLHGELYDYSIAGLIYFRVKFSDMEITEEGNITEGACCYDLTIYTSSVLYDDNSNPMPPAGTYRYGTTQSAGEFSGWFYPTSGGTGSGIQEGTMDIKIEGSTMTVEINLIDEQGKTHCVEYSGIPSIDIAFQL